MERLWLAETQKFTDTAVCEFKELLAEAVDLEFKDLLNFLPEGTAYRECEGVVSRLSIRNLSFDTNIADKARNILVLCNEVSHSPMKNQPVPVPQSETFAQVSPKRQPWGAKRLLNASPGRSPLCKRPLLDVSTVAAPQSPRLPKLAWPNPEKNVLFSPPRKPLITQEVPEFNTPRLRSFGGIGSPIECSTNPSRKYCPQREISETGSPNRHKLPKPNDLFKMTSEQRKPLQEITNFGPRFTATGKYEQGKNAPAMPVKMPLNQFGAIPLLSTKFGSKPAPLTQMPSEQPQKTRAGDDDSSLETLRAPSRAVSSQVERNVNFANACSSCSRSLVSVNTTTHRLQGQAGAPQTPSLLGSSHSSVLVTLPDMESGHSICKDWAQTPELAVRLKEQALLDPAEIYGKMSPIRLEDVFKTS